MQLKYRVPPQLTPAATFEACLLCAGPDASVLYKLYLNCPRMINLHDLYIDFVGEVAPGRTPAEDDEEALYRYDHV